MLKSRFIDFLAYYIIFGLLIVGMIFLHFDEKKNPSVNKWSNEYRIMHTYNETNSIELKKPNCRYILYDSQEKGFAYYLGLVVLLMIFFGWLFFVCN